jgi:peptidoglycan/xylan/chitin deacetylase (PgdA/CDA1 family)
MKAVSVMYHDVVAGERFDETGADDSLPWLLTFDDGGASAATVIAAMLEARGWRGHFFVTTGRVGSPAFLSREQIRDLRGRGHVVGSHSETHPLRMSYCPEEELFGEWRRSLDFLSELLGEEVRVASVPGGYYSRAVAETAARAGVRQLFTSEPTERVNEVDGCLVFGRYGVQRWTSPEAVAGIVAGRFLPRRRQQLVWAAKKLTKRVGGDYYLRARRALIDRG